LTKRIEELEENFEVPWALAWKAKAKKKKRREENEF